MLAPASLRPGGPGEDHFRRRQRAGVVVADLQILRDEDPWELIVGSQAANSTTRLAARCSTWAGALGYGRVWMPDMVTEPEVDFERVGGSASTRCPSCRSRWENTALQFWETVRGMGHFPLTCPLCGAPMPQWTVTR